AAVEYSYNHRGQKTSAVDELGQTTRWAYDSRGNLLEQTRPGGAPLVRYTYDASGNVTSQDWRGHGVTTYEYNAVGLLTRVDDPAGSYTEFDHDSAGNTISVES